MKLLLTSFEPFGGSHINPLEQVVHTLVRDGMTGVALHTAILPVDRQGGPTTLLNYGVMPLAARLTPCAHWRERHMARPGAQLDVLLCM